MRRSILINENMMARFPLLKNRWSQNNPLPEVTHLAVDFDKIYSRCPNRGDMADDMLGEDSEKSFMQDLR